MSTVFLYCTWYFTHMDINRSRTWEFEYTRIMLYKLRAENNSPLRSINFFLTKYYLRRIEIIKLLVLSTHIHEETLRSPLNTPGSKFCFRINSLLCMHLQNFCKLQRPEIWQSLIQDEIFYLFAWVWWPSGVDSSRIRRGRLGKLNCSKGTWPFWEVYKIMYFVEALTR